MIVYKYCQNIDILKFEGYNIIRSSEERDLNETLEQKKERQHQMNLQRLRGLRPMDDDFMRCIFRNNIPLAQKVLRILTGKNDLIITELETQADLKRLVGARSLCLDAIGTDEEGKKYDLEIQRSDAGAGAKRARYHASAMDVDNLEAKQNFEDLPEIYVIFVTENDIYGKGKPFYRIERMNLDADISFDDGEHILYINGTYRGDDEIGNLMHDFCCSNPNDMKDKDMADITRYYKETEEGVSAVCRVMEDMVNEAKLDNSREIAENLLKLGSVSHEDIAKATGLSLEEVKKIAGEISA